MDGDLDLLALSDLGPPSAFWRNDGLVDGVVQWVDDGASLGAALEIAAMGIDSADLNRDGVLDYCISDVGPPRCLLSDGLGGYVEGAHALGFDIAEPIAIGVDEVGKGVDGVVVHHRVGAFVIHLKPQCFERDLTGINGGRDAQFSEVKSQQELTISIIEDGVDVLSEGRGQNAVTGRGIEGIEPTIRRHFKISELEDFTRRKGQQSGSGAN